VDEPTLTVLVLLGSAAVAAGFVDAVVGGGGLVQLPALLVGLPHAAPTQILATNKLASICGTTVSSATYYRRIRPDPRTFLPMMVLAFAGSFTGAAVATQIPRSAFDPIVLVALVVVGGYVLFKPTLGAATALRFAGRRHLAAALAVGFVIGFYDGALGPGTGSFLVFSATPSLRPPRRHGWPTGRPTSARSRCSCRRATSSGGWGWSWAAATSWAGTSARGSPSRGAPASSASSSSWW
jgi:hypothetical protein